MHNTFVHTLITVLIVCTELNFPLKWKDHLNKILHRKWPVLCEDMFLCRCFPKPLLPPTIIHVWNSNGSKLKLFLSEPQFKKYGRDILLLGQKKKYMWSFTVILKKTAVLLYFLAMSFLVVILMRQLCLPVSLSTINLTSQTSGGPVTPRVSST